MVGDIRVTTRFSNTDPFGGLLGALHETGHAMYDLGMPASWRDQPVGRDRGMALEESQSLFLEMIIGRSAPFLRFLLPLLQKHYAVSGPEWEFDNLYRTLTRVQRVMSTAYGGQVLLSNPTAELVRGDLPADVTELAVPVRVLPPLGRLGIELVSSSSVQLNGRLTDRGKFLAAG